MLDDLEDESKRSLVYASNTKRSLAELVVVLCELCVILTELLELLYPASGTIESNARLLPKGYQQQLNCWHTKAQKLMNTAVSSTDTLSFVIMFNHLNFVYY